jgi:hypothetical protein
MCACILHSREGYIFASCLGQSRSFTPRGPRGDSRWCSAGLQPGTSCPKGQRYKNLGPRRSLPCRAGSDRRFYIIKRITQVCRLGTALQLLNSRFTLSDLSATDCASLALCSTSFWASAGSEIARISTAKIAALTAPDLPMARHATGIPAGI